MGKYTHLFQTTSDFNTVYEGTGYTVPWVSYTVQNSAVTYNKDPFNGYEYVDLGLTSGTLWATCNVGASNPEDYGAYYAWGETTEKSGNNAYATDWSDYIFTNNGGNSFTKYNSRDGKGILDFEDDAARVNMGGEWRMPTKDQLEELITLSSTYTTVNGINGWLFTGSNNNTIFIPASGVKYNGSTNSVGTGASLSSVNLYAPFTEEYIWGLNLYGANNKSVDNYMERFYGWSVRGVINP